MRVLKWIGGILLFFVLASVSACFILSKKLPEGVTGEPAQALAAKLETAVNIQGWRQIRAVSWNFRDRNNHLWDRTRGLARVTYGEGKKAVEVYLHVGSRLGIAFKGGERVKGDEEKELVEDGYARWANDSFWLNPVAKLRDRGVTLKVDGESPNGLIMAFSSGGVTPGDTYRFMLGADNKPSEWQMWVSIIPVKGVTTSWDAWEQTPEGAWISTSHSLAGLKVYLKEVKTAATAAELNGGKDPFEALLAEHPIQYKQAAPAPAPSTAPAAPAAGSAGTEAAIPDSNPSEEPK